MYDFLKASAGAAEDVRGFRLYVERRNIAAQRAYESTGMKEAAYKVFEELF
jgi:hypothetical protein